MYNWNAHMPGAGFPIQPPQMMQYPGGQIPFAAQQISFQHPPQQWAQQPPPMAAGLPGMGVMMGQAWPPNTPQGMAHQGMAAINMPGMMTGMNPAPPTQPPPDEKPPLPSEPPPPLPSDPNDQPQPPPEKPKPPLPGQTKGRWDSSTKDSKSSFERQGFSAEHLRGPPPPIPNAQRFQNFDQPMPPQGPPPSKPMPPQGPPPSQPLPPQGPSPGHPKLPQGPPPSQPQPPHGPQPGQPTPLSEPAPSEPLPPKKPSPDPALLSQLEKVHQEEEIFLDQYKQWKKQYDDWREQNQNHPNKEQFMQYLDQWKTYEQQMEARRKSIESQKAVIEEKLLTADSTSLSSASDGRSDTKPEKPWLNSFVKSFSPGSEGSKSRWDKSPAQGDTSGSKTVPGPTGSFKPTGPSGRASTEKQSAQHINIMGGQFGSVSPGDGNSFDRFDDRLGPSQSSGAHNSFDSDRAGKRDGGPASGMSTAGPEMQEEEKGEEDMNLDDEEESGGGGIIESSDQVADKPDPWSQNVQGSVPGWNSWDSGPNNQNQDTWNYETGELQNNPNSDWFQQNTGPRRFDGPNSFRARGPWNAPNIGSGAQFGRGGPGMNQGPRFQGPHHANGMTGSEVPSEWKENSQRDSEANIYGGDDNQGFDDDQGGQGHFYGGRGQFHRGRGGDFQRGRGDFQRGRGNDFQRGRGLDFQRGRGGDFQGGGGRGMDFQRGRGGDFPRGRGGDFQRGRGGDFQGGRGADFQRGRGGDFQRGRGGDFQRGRGGEFQRGRGGDFQRGRGGHFHEGTSEFAGPDYGDAYRGGFRGRGNFPHRGRGGPPSLLSFEFNDQMKDKFSDFDPSAEQEEESGYPPEQNESYEYGEEERGAGGFQDFTRSQGYNEDDSSFGRNENVAQRGRGRGDRGHGFMDRGRGQFRGRGGYMNERSDADFKREDEVSGDFSFAQRGRGGGRGRGAMVGRQNIDEGFNQPERKDEFEEWNESRFDNKTRGGFIRGRGRGFGNPNFMQQFTDEGEGFQSEDGYSNRGRGGTRGRGPARGRGRGMDFGHPDFRAGHHGGHGDFPIEEDEKQMPPAGNMSGMPFETDTTLGRGRLHDEDEPEAKKSRFESNAQGHYEPEMKDRFEADPEREDVPPPFPPPHLRDRFDPLLDPYRGYPDPYYPDRYLDPYAPLPPYGYERYGAALPPRFEPPPERRALPPTESIDYAHGGVAKDKKAFQPAEVIDYGHGQSSESKPALSAQERERVARLGSSSGGNFRNYEKKSRTEPDWTADREGSADRRDSEFDSSSGNSHLRARDTGTSLGGIDLGPLLRTFGLDANSKSRAVVSDRAEEDSDLRGESSHRDYDYGREKSGEDRERIGRDRYGRSRTEDDYGSGYSSRRYDSKESDRRSGDRLYSSNRNDPLGSKERDPYSSRADDQDDRRSRFDSSHSSSSRRESKLDSYDKDNYGSRDPVMRDRYGDPYDVSPRDRYGNYSGDSYGRDARNMVQWGDRDRYGRPLSPPARSTPPLKAPAPSQAKAEVVKVEDLLCPPGRDSRPPQIVTIIRGLPGSGKTYVSKLLREKEISFGGTAPRVLCLDDYFMVEVDKEEVDADTGKKVKKKVLEYEYEQALEEAYRQSLLKSFKKTVDHGLFPFIILDATNEKVANFSEFWSYAKSKGFQVYVGELKVDIATCIQRNIHHWTEWDIEKVKNNWEPLPNHYIRLDLRWLLQEDSISEVIMEDTEPDEEEEKKEEEEEEEESGGFGGPSRQRRKKSKSKGKINITTKGKISTQIYQKSKWELDTSEKTLDKLDGIRVSKKHIAEHQSLDEYLQLDDDYFSRESLPGKKRVRWADLEEKKSQNRRRDLGFIVGQTQQDWERITDDDYANKALNQTKYYYKN